MEKYTLKALKITSVLILSFFGFTGLIGFAKASPPSGYDFGRKHVIHHDMFTLCMWALYCNLAVDYTPGGQSYISRWTTTGSGAVVYRSPWTTYGYSSDVLISPRVGGVYSWVKHMNSADFETSPGTHHGLASAWVYIGPNSDWDSDASWHQYTPWFLWIFQHKSRW